MINKPAVNGQLSKTAAANHAEWTISAARLERVGSWGGASFGMGYLFRPNTLERLATTFELAYQQGLTVGLRGGGNSYGDAAYNEGGIVLDLSRMNKIIAWEPDSGVITVEPGVTLRQLWEYVIEDGWWPPVCTGTAKVTLGGMAAMNVHGKNAYKLGPIGDHIVAFELMMPNGEIIHCSRDENSDIFYAAIGGFGMLGCFTRLTLQMKRIYSGFVRVHEAVSGDLGEMFGQFRQELGASDYLVGWVDGTSTGRQLGRGQIHRGTYVAQGEDHAAPHTLQVRNQHLPDDILGLVPKSVMWRFMRPFFNRHGVRLVNFGKFSSSRLGDGSSHLWTHPQFHFLLDYVPDWKKAYGKGGLIQYQPFVPNDSAETVFKQLLRLSQAHRLPTYLGVLKRHKPDPFLMTHGLDGWSLAMDFPITPRNRTAMQALCREMDALVQAAGGRFYFAKDSSLDADGALAFLGDETIAAFKALKGRCDPHNLLQTNLWRRLFETTP